ncbi:MAG: flagellar biosynthesis protein FlhF [bacterium]
MRVKKFIAPTMAEAMRRVKSELGQDAVIVHTREHRKPILGLFGRPYVEVTAGSGLAQKKPSSPPPEPAEPNPLLPHRERIDRVELSSKATKPSVASPELKALAESVLAQKGTASEIQTEEDVRRDTQVASNVLDRRLASLEEQMIRLSGLIERVAVQESTAIPSEDSNPWKDHLRSQEVEDTVADEILAAIPGQVSRDALREELVRRLTVTGPIDAKLDESGPKVVMLVGPTGVGKTTTLAKIAPRFTHPGNGTRKETVFMTADLFRIAAVEQLQKYSEILRVPLEIVYSPEEASEAIRRHQDADLILIDTGGTGQRNESQISNLASIARACRPVEVHLVVAATTKSCDLTDVIARFGELEPQRLLITKLDESTAFGNILNVAVKSHLPVSYMTTGQMVPEDIEIATSERLADLILGDGVPEEDAVTVSAGITESVSVAGGIYNA